VNDSDKTKAQLIEELEECRARLAERDIAERQESELALQESEEKYRRLVENLRQEYFFYRHGVDGVFTYLSPSITDVLGYPQEEFLTHYSEYLTNTPINEQVARHTDLSIQGEQQPPYEVEILHRDGSIHWLEVAEYPVFDESGQVVAVEGIAHDITEARRTEEALRESEAKFRHLYQNAQVGMARTRISDGKIIECNGKLAQILGYDDRESVIRDYVASEHYVDPGVRQELLDQLETHGEVEEFEAQVTRNDGTPIWVSFSARVYPEHGYLESVVVDITDRKQAEDALRRERDLTRTFLDACPVFFVAIGFDGKTRMMNPAMLDALGYAEDEVRGTDYLTNFIPEEDRERLSLVFSRLTTSGEPTRNENWVLTRDGRKLLVEWHGRAVPGANGDPALFLGVGIDITERKQADEQLALFRQFAEASGQSLGWADLDGTIRYANPALCRIMEEQSTDTVIGQPVLRYYDNGTRRRVQEEILPTVLADGCWSGEVELRGTKGRVTPTIHSLFLLRDSDGEPRHFANVITDIAERRQAERTLRLTQFAIDHASDMAFWVQSDGSFTYANDAACTTLGYSRDELLSMAVPDIDENVPQGAFDGVWQEIKARGSFTFESRLRTKDGRTFPVEVTPNFLEFEGQGYCCAFVKNITERTRAQEALQEREATLQSVLRSAPAGIGLVRSGRLVWINENLCQMTGYGEQELIDQPARMLYSSDADLSWVKREGERLEQERGPGSVETRWQRKDGRVIDVLLISIPFDPEDLSRGVTFAALDITERKKAEEEKERLESQLRQAQKMEAIGTLAGGIAHDFNNILTPIAGYSEMALDAVPPESTTYNDLQEVLAAATRASDLVRQILTFARQRDHELVPVRVTPVVKEVMKLLRASLPSTIEIRQQLGATSETILADPTELHQILMNLCTNAGHAMRETGGILTVSLADVALTDDRPSPRATGGPFVKLSVSDTGHGIEPEALERIFNPYFTTKSKQEGTGLGLAVVHGIVENYGGHVTVDSTVGQGTTFDVFLPVVEPKTSAPGEETAPLPTGRERILWVDDEPTLVEACKRMVGSLGYDIAARTSSIEALEAFRANPDEFDLVITDMTMPSMTGVELARALMAIRPDIPIILCTGFSELVSENQAKALGIREFVMKPILRRNIAEAIRRALRKEA